MRLDMSLSLKTRIDSGWWHGISLVVKRLPLYLFSLIIFWSWHFHPLKGLQSWSLWGASIIKFQLCFWFMLPLFIIFARYSSRVLAMRSLEYFFLKSPMMSNYFFENLLIYHVLCIFSVYAFTMCSKGSKGLLGSLWKAKWERIHGFDIHSCAQERDKFNA